ncbi:MAG TPA: T9SS type A sorting domain-containing protein [Ignavibacteriaceae bacterium]|nr:T9SS type A sorting domain-containing protein [Ignavibacteriaceae bacterium]
MENRYLFLAITIILLLSISVKAQNSTVYSENFNSNPGYTVHPDVATNDTVGWNPAGYYRVKIHEDGSSGGKQKFAYSPVFSEVNNISFSLKVDLRNELESWGHEAAFLLCQTDNSATPQIGGLGKQPALFITRDDVNHRWMIQDTLNHQWYTPVDNSNKHWYRFEIDYDAQARKVNIQVKDLGLNVIVYNISNQDAVFGNFNRVVLGEHTAYWDGTLCETDYDNILITKPNQVIPKLILTKGIRNSNDHDIYKSDLDGTNLSLIYDDSGICQGAQVSDDGSKLVFNSNSSSTGKHEIFLLNLTNSNTLQLTANNYFYGTVLPKFFDQSKIWYTSAPQAGVNEWWEMNYDGSAQIQKTNWQSLGKQSPRFNFNFNKSKVVYEKGDPSWAPSHEIYLANLNLSGEVQLTNNSGWSGEPIFSPDGTNILCSEETGSLTGIVDIWKMDINGGNKLNLTNVSSNKRCDYPFYSLDGSKIFYSYFDGNQYDIYSMNPDGSNKLNITNTPNYDEIAWSVSDKLNTQNITDGLVAYYPFSGNANDLSGNGNNGTVTGAVLTTDRFGNSNSAYYFNGSTDSIKVTNSSSLNVEKLTIACWVYYEGGSYNGHIVSKGLGQYDLFVETTVNSIIGGHINGSSIRSGTSLEFNRWTFLCLVKDNDSAHLFMDGQKIKSEAIPGNISASLNNLLIGRHPQDANSRFRGKIDDIRIYNRPLSVSEILTLYNYISGSEESAVLNTSKYLLLQNYPNPFNPSTLITYQLPQKALVSLKVFDILGKEVITLVAEEQSEGSHSVNFNAQNLSTGVYFYQLKAGDFVSTKKLVLIK